MCVEDLVQKNYEEKKEDLYEDVQDKEDKADNQNKVNKEEKEKDVKEKKSNYYRHNYNEESSMQQPKELLKN